MFLMGKRKRMTRREWLKSYNAAMEKCITDEPAVASHAFRMALRMAFARGVSWAYSDEGTAELVSEAPDGANNP